MKKVIYTAIIDDYDRLKPAPRELREGWELRCFTDQVIADRGDWHILPVERGALSRMAMARRIKILGHQYLPDADVYLWMDASVTILGDLNFFMERFAQREFTLFRHPRRNCIYEEIRACMLKKKADSKLLERQEKVYREMRYPAGSGLMMTGVLCRKKTKSQEQFNANWWTLTESFQTWRDQLTLPLVDWVSLSKEPYVLDYAFYKNFFRTEPHMARPAQC